MRLGLGDEVRCRVTGYCGVVVGRTEWLYGSPTVTVQGRGCEAGIPVDTFAGPEERFELAGKKAAALAWIGDRPPLGATQRAPF